MSSLHRNLPIGEDPIEILGPEPEPPARRARDVEPRITRRRRAERALAVVGVALMLLAFALAGSGNGGWL